MTAAPPGLLAITPGTTRDRASMHALKLELAAAFEAGLRAVSLREPELPDALLLELTKAILELAEQHETTWIGVHDSIHVALAAGAHSAHLGFRSLPVESARTIAAGELALGFSAHAGDAPDCESVTAADYLTFGPVLETPSKQGLVEATGFDQFRVFAERVDSPVFALGGIGPEQVQNALAAGAHGVAAIRGLFAAGDIGAATTSYLAALSASPNQR